MSQPKKTFNVWVKDKTVEAARKYFEEFPPSPPNVDFLFAEDKTGARIHIRRKCPRFVGPQDLVLYKEHSATVPPIGAFHMNKKHSVYTLIRFALRRMFLSTEIAPLLHKFRSWAARCHDPALFEGLDFAPAPYTEIRYVDPKNSSAVFAARECPLYEKSDLPIEVFDALKSCVVLVQFEKDESSPAQQPDGPSPAQQQQAHRAWAERRAYHIFSADGTHADIGSQDEALYALNCTRFPTESFTANDFSQLCEISSQVYSNN
jgi:hypothetical protein